MKRPEGWKAMTNTTDSSKWIRFSDYEIRVSDDGTKYVCPVPGSSPVFYDPMLRPEKLAVAVLDAADKLKDSGIGDAAAADRLKDSGTDDATAAQKNRADDTIILDLVRSVGLPGFALGSAVNYEFPFGGSPASEKDILLSQRGPEYCVVFSESYAEKYDDIIAWLENIRASAVKGPDLTTLESIAEYCVCSLSGAGKLHVCAVCKKNYYSEDPESRTCSKVCGYQLVLRDPKACAEKGYYCQFFSKPRRNQKQ